MTKAKKDYSNPLSHNCFNTFPLLDHELFAFFTSWANIHEINTEAMNCKGSFPIYCWFVGGSTIDRPKTIGDSTALAEPKV